MEVNIKPSKVNIDINTQRISSGGIKQIYKGDTEPTDHNILIWIDTSGVSPTTNIQFVTKDNLIFITKDNFNFIVKEE